jgi:hypothetical protein
MMQFIKSDTGKLALIFVGISVISVVVAIAFSPFELPSDLDFPVLDHPSSYGLDVGGDLPGVVTLQERQYAVIRSGFNYFAILFRDGRLKSHDFWYARWNGSNWSSWMYQVLPSQAVIIFPEGEMVYFITQLGEYPPAGEVMLKGLLDRPSFGIHPLEIRFRGHGTINPR